MAAAIEYLVAEILELAGHEANRGKKKKRINPRHINLVVRTDQELGKLLANVTISEGGVKPSINAALMGKKAPRVKKQKKAAKKTEIMDSNDDD